jgi:hypothetical protein
MFSAMPFKRSERFDATRSWSGSSRFDMRKERLIAVTVFAILPSVSCTTFDTMPTPQVTIQAQPTNQSAIDTQALESRLGLVFIPATASETARAKVSKEDAITKARGSAPVQQATSVNTELGYLSNPTLEQMAARGEKVDPTLLSHPLVWIVSFQGLELPSSGPPGSTHRVAHEYNVVIDAITGDYLMGFIYR